ncbi:MAG: Ribosome small subunit-stimulated GTPase EngC [uncultured Thiotrichaceae bacterium]|uniref:Small ribosomal subunit biogenesis GTPase RsgA n=1 Tax=uncultured Thiotrichaceae bacterium TaxID=298394 RepID=A0A6S6STV9_9GAMM|nr:MAG: Ribosome small subunit-stimulated GTPase EngC [uncultured Thiotrichaceae bacterium]
MVEKSQDIGRVISRFGAELILATYNGEHIRCTTRRKLDNVASGDYVRWQKEAQGNAVVTAIEPRKNVLSRPDFRGKIRVIAANIDVLIVVSSWRPEPSWEMLDRYLVAAEQLPAEVIIVMNKADLRGEYSAAADDVYLEEYSRIGYQVIHTDTKTGQGIAEISDALGEKTAILAGQSGVGKSSLIACLLPEQSIRVGEIGDTGEGRHTTTVATLYRLAGGSLIDSPGVRDFALPPLNPSELQSGYPEFAEFAGMCKFNNCTHQHEPGCVIKSAVKSNDLPPHRYQRYLNLLTRQINH